MQYANLVKEIKHIDEKNILSFENISKKNMPIAIKEAFSNALEAIKVKNPNKDYEGGLISCKVYLKKDLADKTIIDRIEILDNGIGFNYENFTRFIQFINRTKGFGNKGTGRFSILGTFSATYKSIYRNNEDKLSSVEFNFKSSNPSSDMFCSDFQEEHNLADDLSTGTILKLYPLSDKDGCIDAEQIKELIKNKFLLEFILNSNKLPQMIFEQWEKTPENTYERTRDLTLSANDLPTVQQTQTLSLPFKIIKNNELENSSEKLDLDLYSLMSSQFQKNEMILTSNNCSVEHLPFESIKKSDTFDDNRYLLLVKSSYLDDQTTTNNDRTSFNFKSKKEARELAKAPHFSESPFIIREDLTHELNKKFTSMHPEVSKKVEESDILIQNIREKYLISDAIFEKTKNKLSLDCSPQEILSTFYMAESEELANATIDIDTALAEISQITPSDPDINDKIQNITKKVTSLIPIQNRTALTQYVTRRRLILELFDSLLEKSKTNSVLEKEFHDLFLVQHTANSIDSNLWLLNEDFLYFAGHSDEPLCNLTIDDKKVFRDDFSAEEERYIKSLGEDRTRKKPDVILFPNEGKCVIIEFKKADINISDHLNQIARYAALILNYSKDEFQFNQFYGYLVGEGLEPNDVRFADADFKQAYHLDYMFRPEKSVAGINGKGDGYLYMEILKYSTLLERAKMRNSVFTEKLKI